MKRLALAVVLSISITHVAVAQHHEGGSSSASSGSSGSSGGSSSGGGYSGGSHSAGPSGGYSGGSHSSGGSGSSVGYSGAGSPQMGGSHSGAGSSRSGPYLPSSAAGGGSHSGNSSARSNMRPGTSSVEHLGDPNRTTGLQGNPDFAGTWQGMAGRSAGSQLRLTSGGEPWMNKPYALDISAKNLNRALAHHELDSKLQPIGLESSKAAYREKLAAFGMDPKQAHRPNWFARMLGAKAVPPTDSVLPQLRPCLTKECKPVPVPPRPCAGAKCPVPPVAPTPTPSTGVCINGYDAWGYCMPWGYIDGCNTRYNHCYVWFARVNPVYCGTILQQIRREQSAYRQVELTEHSVCASDPQGQECGHATKKLQNLGKSIFQLEDQYRLCQTATGWSLVDPSWSAGNVAPPSWPSTSWPYFWPPLF